MILTFAASANTARAAGKDSVGSLLNSATSSDDFARTTFGFNTTAANDSIPYQLNFEESSHIGLCFYMWTDNAPLINDSLHFVKIYDVSGSLVFTLKSSGTNGRIYCHDYTESTSVGSTDYANMVTDAWVRVDINISIAESGSVSCMIDGTLIYEKTGVDTTLSSALTAMDKVVLLSPNPTQGLVYPNFHYRSAIVTDGEDTVGLEMFMHTVESDGSYTGLTGTFASVDNLNIDNTDGLIALNGGLTSTVNINNIPATLDSYEVVGFGMAARCFTSGNVKINLFATDGVNDLETTPDTYDTQYTPVIKVFPTAPDGTAWTKTQVNVLEVGVRTSE